MMKYLLFYLRPFLLTILFSASISFLVFSQSQKNVDSLLKELNKAKADTSRVVIYKQLFFEYFSGDTAIALTYYNKGLELAIKSGNLEKMADFYTSFSRYCNQKLNYSEAFKYCKKAISLYEKIISNSKSDSQLMNSEIGISAAYSSLGYYYEMQFELGKALEYYKKALKNFEKYGRKSGIARCYSDIGCVKVTEGDYVLAIENFQKSLKFSIEIGDKNQTASCYNNLGIINDKLGKYPEAISCYQKSLVIYEGIGDKNGIASCNLNIALVHDSQDNHLLALEYLEKSIAIMKEIGDLNGLAYCYTTYADIHTKIKKYSVSIEYYKKAQAILEKTGDLYGLSFCINNIGITLDESGQYMSALEYYQKSIDLKEKIGEKAGIASTIGNIAGLYNSIGKPFEAISYARKSIEIAKQYGLLYEEKDAYLHLYDAYKILHKPNEALENYILYTSIKDSMFSVEKNKLLTEMEVRYQSEKRQLQINELEKEKNLQNEIIIRKNSETHKQRIIIYTFIVGFIIILFFSFLISRLYVQKRRANILITEKNKDLQMANEEINSQKEEIEVQRDMVMQQKEHIEEQKNEITDSINYAKRIQQAILPTGEFADKVMGEHFILFKPKDIVSGDFYWATRINEYLIVTVADCTGHGVPGAFMSMLGVSFLNEIVRKKEVTKASETLDHLREYIIDALQQKGDISEQKDGMDMTYCVLNTQTNILQFAGANNPLYIVKSQKSKVESLAYRQAGENLSDFQTFNFQLIELKGDKMPVAIYEDMKPFTNHEVQLSTGDCIYLTSDGFVDQFGGPNNKKFMVKQLKELFVNIVEKPMCEQKEILDNTFENWKGSNEQTDDVTILGLKI